MKEILIILQIFVSSLLILTILLQSRGEGLSSGAFGKIGSSYQSRRGAEKSLFLATISLSVLFFIIQIAILVI